MLLSCGKGRSLFSNLTSSVLHITRYNLSDKIKLTEGNLSLANGLLSGQRSSLAKAITLMESSRKDHRDQADLLQQYLLKNRQIKGLWSSKTFRIGIAGPPGAGKSSTIERFGMKLIDLGHRVAVIPIDPSSQVSGGSILGDKTRMTELSKSENAYVRASPTRCALGGIAEHTSDVVTVCESTGYDTIIVESVGLGQSEIELDQAVDIFVLLIPPGAGDDLQASKKGVMEFADLVAVNKADGDLLALARETVGDYSFSVKYIRRKHSAWEPKVFLFSARTGYGIDDFVKNLVEFNDCATESNEIFLKRAKQSQYWMWAHFQKLCIDSLNANAFLKNKTSQLTRELEDGITAPRLAAVSLHDAFLSQKNNIF